MENSIIRLALPSYYMKAICQFVILRLHVLASQLLGGHPPANSAFALSIFNQSSTSITSALYMLRGLVSKNSQEGCLVGYEHIWDENPCFKVVDRANPMASL